MRIRLINDVGLSDKDFATFTNGVKHFVPLVTHAWKMVDAEIVAGGTPEDGDWLIYLTEKNRHPMAAGYHTTLNGHPVSYCSLKNSYYVFGRYSKALVIKGKTIHGATYRGGLLTTVCHEIAEMLCDPYIKTVSSVDAQGRKWLIEVCDHVFGSYMNVVIDSQNCVLPDVTTPAFYDLKGTKPFSILDATNAPFTMTPSGYAYYMDDKGILHKI
jgi:hypothetical protein